MITGRLSKSRSKQRVWFDYSSLVILLNVCTLQVDEEEKLGILWRKVGLRSSLILLLTRPLTMSNHGRNQNQHYRTTSSDVVLHLPYWRCLFDSDVGRKKSRPCYLYMKYYIARGKASRYRRRFYFAMFMNCKEMPTKVGHKQELGKGRRLAGPVWRRKLGISRELLCWDHW